MDIPVEEKRSSWLDRPLFTTLALNAETILWVIIIVLAIVSRLYDLGARVVSHDETIHYYLNSYNLYKGLGYRHDPLSHGPFPFHMMALSYFLFGASDFTGRLPAALCSIATIAFMWFYRRYLGRAGALVAATMLLISPFILYYGRYAREDGLVVLFFAVSLWAIFRYLETGKARYTYALFAVTALHFATKETAFIYVAEAMIFLAAFFVFRISQKPWPRPERRNIFLIALMVTLVLAGLTGAYFILNRGAAGTATGGTVAPAIPGQPITQPMTSLTSPIFLILFGLVVVAILVAAYYLITGYSLNNLREERSFDLLMLFGLMVLPMLGAFPVKLLGFNPIDYNNSQIVFLDGLFLILLSLIAIVIGLVWKPRLWLINTAIFYGIFTVFFTTVFTNGFGMITGLVGSLGYWLEQQGVNRGSQPWYYYLLIQVPIYEFLPALSSLLAVGIVIYHRIKGKQLEVGDQKMALAEQQRALDEAKPTIFEKPPVLALLIFWSISSEVAFMIAGEKMPWLTVHITLPMILLGAWAIGFLIESTDWSVFRSWRPWLVVLLLPVFLFSALAALGSLLGVHPPFQGKDLEQLNATTTFITALISAILSGVGLAYLLRPWATGQVYRVLALFIFAFLGVLTARTAFRAAYITYDYATEFLVYAHGAPGDKLALAQIEEISRRMTDGLSLPVAYDNETAYPFFWYLRDFTNAQYYGASPTRSLRDVPIILVSDSNYSKIEQVVGNSYDEFEYTRLWWPNQDYFGLTWNRIWNALRNPQMREALYQIWLNRDYSLYGQLTNKDMSTTNWQPAAKMRLYIRKDVAAKIWNYGAAPAPEQVVTDPYAGKGVTLNADKIIGSAGTNPGQLNRPRDLAVAPDGSIYVADTDNHRIQHLAADGTPLQVWGTFADIAQGTAPGGTFNQPWGIAVGQDGSVYVADTWNYRIQKFTSDGQFVKMWGTNGQGETPEAFWGPRDVAVDANNHVFVTDTGNKRVVEFDSEGNFITQFGQAGMDPGQFDEPVGLTIDSQGRVYVVDTWNQRIQVFTPDQSGNYQPTKTWDVAAWYGKSLDNKPYIAVDDKGHVFATDPEGYRVLEFTDQGEFVMYWGDAGTGSDSFGLAGSVAVDPKGGVWVSDAGNSRLMHFTLPGQ
jgi:predicted membrane-bound mannosyltransferase/sugar lactone lactonase YvrE